MKAMSKENGIEMNIYWEQKKYNGRSILQILVRDFPHIKGSGWAHNIC